MGCGTGKPITEAILRHLPSGKVYAVDSSEAMVEIFRTNFPNVQVVRATIASFDFFDTQFDAVISWGVMFHLSEEEQRQAIAKVASAVREGGYFLFTSGQESEVQHGKMYDVDFSYRSLGAEEYRRLLLQHGLTVIDEHFDKGENYYYLAQKQPLSIQHQPMTNDQ